MHVLATPFGPSAESIICKDYTIDNVDGFRTFAIRLALRSRLLRISALSCNLGSNFLLLANCDVKAHNLSAFRWPFRNKVEDTHKRFTTGKKVSFFRLESVHRSLVSRFAPDVRLSLEGFADNFEAVRYAALFTLACGVILINYFANKQYGRKDLDKGFVLEEAKVSLHKWILVLSPTPFNRFVITRCPSISTNQSSYVDEDVSGKLQLMSYQVVSLSTGMPQNLFTADSSEKEREAKTLFTAHSSEKKREVKSESPQYNSRKLRDIEYQRYCLPTQDGGVVALDWPRHLDLAGEHGLDTTLLLIPGTVKGNTEEGLRIIVQRALLSGYFPVVLNPRGCGGSPITTPRIYAPGDSDDVRLVANYVTQSRPWATLMSIGWGLGANMLTKYLGKEADSTPVSAAVSINNPFNLELATRLIVDNHINQFERELIEGYVQILRSNKLLFQGQKNKFDVSKGLASTSLQEFDSAISMVAHGFDSLEDFYLDGSSIAFLQRVKTPLLSIQVDNLLPSKFLPHYLFNENPFLTLLSPYMHEAQMAPHELAFMASTAQEQSIIVFEWLGAVELALLKGRHPLMQNVDIAISPAQGQSFKPDDGITDRTDKGINVVDTCIESEEFSIASKSSEGKTLLQFPEKEFSEDGVIQNIDVPSGSIPKKQHLQSKPPVANGGECLEHASESAISNFNHDMENEHSIIEGSQKSQVRDTLESALNAIDSTMPGTLSDEQKEQVLDAVERGETLVTALQGAVPEDVRGKMIDAVFGAVQARGISFKLVGLGEGMLPSSLSEGVKKMVQEKLAAVALKKDQDHYATSNKDKVISSEMCEHPNHDAQKICQKLDEDDAGGQGRDQNQQIEVAKADGQSGKQIEEATHGSLMDFDDLFNNKSDQSKENPLGSKDGREIYEDKILTETAVEGNPAVAAKDAKNVEERLDDKFEEEGPVTELNHAQSLETGNGIEKKSIPDSIVQDSTDQMENKSLKTNNQTENKGHEMQSDNVAKTQEGHITSSMSTVPDHSTPDLTASSFPPAIDMQKALEALTGFDDSTQVAVTNVFGVIESMIEQLEKEKHDNDLTMQNALTSLHSSTESTGKAHYSKDSETSVEHTTESKSGNREESEFSSLSGGSNVMLSKEHTSEYQNGSEVEPKCDSLLQKAERPPVGILNPVKESDQQKQDDFKASILEQDLHARTVHKECQNLRIPPSLQEQSSKNNSKIDNYHTENADFAEMVSSETIPARNIRTCEPDSVYQGIGAFNTPFRNSSRNGYEESSGFGSQRASPLGEQHEIHANQLQQEELQQADVEVMTLEGSEPVPSFIARRDVHLSLSIDDMEPGSLDMVKENDTHSNEGSEKPRKWSESFKIASEERYSSNFPVNQTIEPVNKKKSCFSNVVHKLVLDALRSVILRRLELLGLKALGADAEEEIDNITNAVAQEAYRSKWGYEPQILMKEKASKQNFRKLRLKLAEFDEAKEFQVLPADAVVRAVSSSYSGTHTLQRLVPFGVVSVVILSALGSVFPIMEVEWEQEQLIPGRRNLQRIPLECQYEMAIGNPGIEKSFKDLVGNCNVIDEGTYGHAGSNISSCDAVDVVGRSVDKENNGALMHDRPMMGAVTAAMCATAAYATNRLNNTTADQQDRTMATFALENQRQESTECKEDDNEANKESFVSTIAEKAVSFAAPVVPTNEDGKVDHDRLVAMLADLGQKGGMLRFIGKAALLWGGLRGAMSLTDRLLIFFRISDRPLGERLLGFAGMAVLLWSPIMIPLLPTFLRQWASRSPSGVAGCASVIGLYGAVLILITIWGKRIRGYEHPLEQYGLQIFSQKKLKSLLAGTMLGLLLVLALYFAYWLLGYMQFLKAAVVAIPKDIPALLLTYWHMTKLVGQAFGIGFAVAVVEEVLFRSWLQEEIAVDLGYHKSVLLSGLAFAIFHWSLPAIPGLWLLSIALAGARARTNGELAFPVGIHVGLIASNFVLNVGGLVSYVPSAPAWVTGRHAGNPLAGVLGMTMVALLALFLYPWKYHDRFKRGWSEGLSVQ